MRLCLLMVFFGLMTLSLLAAGESNPTDTRAERALIRLEDSLSPLAERFNADEGKLRVIALLSPT